MNDQIEITISLSCHKCGGHDFTPDEGAPDNAIVTCTRCGETMGTMREVKSFLHDQARKEMDKQAKAIERQFRDLFR